MGTANWLAPGGQPVGGIAILMPELEMSLLQVDVRLPAGDQALAPVVLREAAASSAMPPTRTGR